MFRLPEEISFEEGTFIEPLGTVLRGLRISGLTAGETVLVIGSGMAGLLHVKTARTLGAGRIIAVDLCRERLEAARRFGAEYCVEAGEDVPAFVKKVNNGRLADQVILCAGVPSALGQALHSVGSGGTLLLFAVPRPGEETAVDFNPYWRNDISIKTSYGSTPLDHLQAMEMIRRGKVKVKDMITHRFPLSKIEEGFATASKAGSCLKVMIEPAGESGLM